MPSPTASSRDERLIASLLAGDEASFTALVDECEPVMTRVARWLAPSPRIADEVLQDAWTAALRGLDAYEARSTLRAWILATLVGQATARGGPTFGADASSGPAVDPARFRGEGHAASSQWARPPAPWSLDAASRGELRELVRETIECLPRAQRVVVTLRDVEGWTAEEVCEALEMSTAEHRTLLHAARSALLRAIDSRLGSGAPTSMRSAAVAGHTR